MQDKSDSLLIIASFLSVIALFIMAVLARHEPRYERPEPDYVMGTCSHINC